MYRYVAILLTLVFVAGCASENYPSQCVVQEFDEKKYEGVDYPVIRDAIYQIDVENYECFRDTALEMLKTPEKQFFYKTTIFDKHTQILIETDWQNKYLEGELAGREAEAIITDSRLNAQILVDKFLRKQSVKLDRSKIPDVCQKYKTPKERNVCYEQLFTQYIDKYIFEGYSKRFQKRINYKPEFTKVFREGIEAIRELLESASDDEDYIEQYMERYYLDLMEHFFWILYIHV